jgi:enoyl-CoA hydratase/carnithine racemase
MAESETLLEERRGAVVLLTLNRPESRNAVNQQLADALEGAFTRLREDDAVRVVVLTGSGAAFCSGADLKQGRPVETGRFLVGTQRPLTHAVDGFPKLVVAAVNGAAFGGGCELVLAADVRVAACTASFCLPEVRIGSLPGSGGIHRLVLAVGLTNAAKMLYSGEPVPALEALRIGLVSDLFKLSDLVEAASDLAGRIAANAPLSILALKQALAHEQSSSAATLERDLWALLATTDDRAEGRAAFREHRPPNYRGR